MTKEGKSVTLALLTVFIFGLTTYLNDGKFIFPFPLNEAIFLIVAIIIGKLHFRDHRKESILIISTAFVFLFSSEFYWSIPLNNDQMLWLSSSIVTDIFGLLGVIGLTVWTLTVFSFEKNSYIRSLAILPSALILIGAFVNNAHISFIGSIFPFLLSIKQLSPQRQLGYLWILWVLLEGTKLWSLA